MHSPSEVLYKVPWAVAAGLKEELNGMPPREKTCIVAAYLGKGGGLLLCGVGGKTGIASELGIEPEYLDLC